MDDEGSTTKAVKKLITERNHHDCDNCKVLESLALMCANRADNGIITASIELRRVLAALGACDASAGSDPVAALARLRLVDRKDVG